MPPTFSIEDAAVKEKFSDRATVVSLCKILMSTGVALYFIFIVFTNRLLSPAADIVVSSIPKSKLLQLNSSNAATNINHILFGLHGTQGAWHLRKDYVEAWWRPGETKGYLYLDKDPTTDLLPWSSNSPPYRISEDLSKLIAEIDPAVPHVLRMVHGIKEILREDHEGFRWLVMGDEDSIIFVDNMIDVLAEHDHSKYYYIGYPSEYIFSNFWFSFNMAFGGGGIVLSYPLATALAKNMDSCLRRYPYLRTADIIIMSCISDIGVNLSPQKGIHQIDFRGDLSGFLSSHPKAPLVSLHHFDVVDPIFPNMDRFEATRHLMKAAAMDQSRLLQQTICHQRQQSWTISVSWGYSAHLYEKIMPRSWLQNPIETFQKWIPMHPEPPHYMFKTRLPTNDPCDAPHVFFFNSTERLSGNLILTRYIRFLPRGIETCGLEGSHSADLITEIHVHSPATKRVEMDRCECCDISYAEGMNATRVEFRECVPDEIIA